ncbi:MAG: hypothetical protein K9M80_01440 [Candidatus Marinimicrobia bacterium]|nr:hypothetical protein [Candidatus Neomarinimicrobiota bacterium]
MEKLAYALLIIITISWVVAILVGIISAFPAGLIGLLGIIAFGLLFIKVLKERLENEEDNYYSKNVDK